MQKYIERGYIETRFRRRVGRGFIPRDNDCDNENNALEIYVNTNNLNLMALAHVGAVLFGRIMDKFLRILIYRSH